MSRKKRKPLPAEAAAAASAVKMPQRDTRADGNAWFGTADQLTDSTSQKIGDGGIGAGLSAPNYTQPGETTAGVDTPAQAFIAAVRANDKAAIKMTYAVLPRSGPASIAAAYEIKDAFFNGSAADRATFKANVTANKEIFPAKNYADFQTMMTMTSGAVESGMRWVVGPRPKPDTKPPANPVALEGQDALANMGGAGGLGSGAVNLNHLAGVDTRLIAAADYASQKTGDRYYVPSSQGGARTQAQANANAKAGTGVSDSLHIADAKGVSHAADIMTVGADGKSRYASPAFASAMQEYGQQQGFSVRWGNTPGFIHSPFLEGRDPVHFDLGLNSRLTGVAFSPGAAAPVATASAAGNGGTPEARHVRDLLITGRPDLGVKPLPAAVAAGAVGNMMQEAYQNLRPDALGAAGEKGIGQWMPDRYANMVTWTTANGLDPNSREGQALFYSHELQASPTMAKLATVQTPAEAAQVIATGFERAGTPMMDRRIGFANAVAGGTEIAIASGQDLVAGGDRSAAGRDVVAAAIRATGGISKGSRNTAANKAVQGALASLAVGDRIGAPLKADGVFGNRTKEAVKNFQAREGLKPDGVVGPATLAKINASLAAANFGGATGTEGSPELAGQVAPTSTRDFAAGAAAAAVTVDPAVTASFGRSTTATLAAAVNHPDTFVSSDKEWDPAAARIAGILRDGAAMDAQAKAAMAKAGKTSFAPPIEGNAVPQTLEEYLGGGPGTGPGKEHQFPPQQGLGADVNRAWESAQRAFDIEHWLQEPTVDSGAGTGTFGTVTPASDPYRPTGGYEPGGSNSSSSGGFDAFASGMAQTYTTVGGGGSVFGGSTGGGSATVYSGVTPTTYQDSGNPAGNDYSNVGGIP